MIGRTGQLVAVSRGGDGSLVQKSAEECSSSEQSVQFSAIHYSAFILVRS